jgi:hypothetical protein
VDSVNEGEGRADEKGGRGEKPVGECLDQLAIPPVESSAAILRFDPRGR